MSNGGGLQNCQVELQTAAKENKKNVLLNNIGMSSQAFNE